MLIGIARGLLWPYSSKSMGIYRCPDQRQVFAGVDIGGSYQTFVGQGNVTGYLTGNLIAATPVRSYSISAHVNGGPTFPGSTYLTYTEQIVQPDPSMAFVFIDENVYTICDAQFNPPTLAGWSPPFYDATTGTTWPPAPVPETWSDVPSARHGGTGTLSFADGHCEMHRWLEPATARLNSPAGLNPAPGINGQPNRDIAWVEARSFSGQSD